MKKATTILLVGVTLTSTITAGITSSNSLDYKSENIELNQKLKESFDNYDKLQVQNKRLSKRVISEINRIITLSDSVKHLDIALKKNILEQEKIVLSSKIDIQEKALTSRNTKANGLTIKHKQLNNQITKSKQEVIEIKKSITEPIFISDVEAIPMKKKIRGGFTETGNYKKIDGFKTSFQIINNDIANANTKKVSLRLSNPENSALDFTNEIEVNFDKKFLNINSLVEVDRKKITSGNYQLDIMVDNKKIKSSNIEINIK